jgi:hypothetical protein
MVNWEVVFEVTPDLPELAGLVDQWCRQAAPTDSCTLAEGGAVITHRLRAGDEGEAARETLDQARLFFNGFHVQLPGIRRLG